MIAKNSRLRKRLPANSLSRRRLRAGRRAVVENVIAGAVFLAVLGGILGFFVYQNVSAYQKRSALEERLQELQGEMAELMAEQEMLENAVEDAQTEEHVERVLREQGLYKREGEQVVTVLPPEEDTTEGLLEDGSEEKRVWWQPWTWFGAN